MALSDDSTERFLIDDSPERLRKLADLHQAFAPLPVEVRRHAIAVIPQAIVKHDPSAKSIKLENHLLPAFIQAMSEIGAYGLDKYGDASFESQAARGEAKRSERQQSFEIAKHAAVHFEEYLQGAIHDRFGTRGHQLAAVAFNAMMEYYFLMKESY